MIDTETSIDRLTIVGYDVGIFSNYLKNSEYINSTGFSRNYGFRHSYSGLRGEHIETGDKGKVRIDFNPNKANMDQVEKMISGMKYPHLTRLDIAIDYFGKDLSTIDWTSSGRRKRNYWVDHKGTLETLYIGAPSSDKRFRIYNKALERKENSHGEWEKDWEMQLEKHPLAVNGHWRVEVQKRFKERDNILNPKEYFLPNLFDIRAISKYVDVSHIENPMERGFVLGAMINPSLLDEIHRNSRTKYNKMIKEAKERGGKALEIEPHEIYEKEKSRLAHQLNDLFAKAFMPLQLSN